MLRKLRLLFMFLNCSLVPFVFEGKEARDKFSGAVEAFSRRNSSSGVVALGDSSRQKSSEVVMSPKDLVDFIRFLSCIVCLVSFLFYTFPSPTKYPTPILNTEMLLDCIRSPII